MGLRERKEREKGQRRDEIIAAGKKIFLKKGFISATMEEIARECELSKATLYLYFPGKEQLFFTIVLMAMTEMCNLMERSQEGISDAIERIGKIGEAYLDFYDRYPEYFRILSRAIDYEFDIFDENVEMGIKIQEMNGRVWRLMTGIIKDGIREGIFRSDTDPVEICIELYASSSMIIQLMDHAGRYARNIKHMTGKYPADHGDILHFTELDFRKTLHSCGERIIYSILEKPAAKQARGSEEGE